MTLLAAPTQVFSAKRVPFHDGMDEGDASFEFACPTCARICTRHAYSAVSEGGRWYASLTRQEQRAIADVFGFAFSVEGPSQSAYARMPHGELAWFSLETCPQCATQSVVAIEFYEMQPARYIGVLQGVAAILKPA